MLKKTLAAKVFTIAFILGFYGEGHAGELLTGDTRLACEAILCLSSPARPGECAPSLARYFGINEDKWSDTVRARRNFLNLCPSVGEDEALLVLNSSISQAAGRCGADELNARGRWIVTTAIVPKQDCRNQNINQGNYQESWHWQSNDRGSGQCVNTVRYWLVDPNPPGYCLDLWRHQYTYFEPVRYIRGQNPWEHHWSEK